MQQDFHYYATYCAAIIAGYSHEESIELCYGAQLVDHCSKTFLNKLHADSSAATTQLQLEMMSANTTLIGLQDITRIWSAFHFLPRDLHADPGKRSRIYRSKYRLICGPNGDLLEDTVKLAKDAGTLPAAGIAMHILADTWAHSNFAGTPSLVINNTNYFFYELLPKEGSAEFEERKVSFVHNPSAPDDPGISKYTNSLYQSAENAIMNLGHGRAGHLPDYSFIRFKYLPAWNDYNELIKDNPSDYYHAFCQMVYAMQYLRGSIDTFEKDRYAWDTVAPWKAEIMSILEKRQLIALEDWKVFGEKLSGFEIDDFSLEKYEQEYITASAPAKDSTYLGKFIRAAINQKSMVTNRIFRSGNLSAGFSVSRDKNATKELWREFRKEMSRD